MCFSMKAPAPPPIPPTPNRADVANQAAVTGALARVRNQNATAQTTITGSLGDPTFGQNVNAPKLSATLGGTSQ